MKNHLSRPAFVIGITGHLDPNGDTDEISETLASLFRFLKNGAAVEREFFDRLPCRDHAPGLEQWPGLADTPILVLTSLAPGADTLAAEVALRPEFSEAGFQVLAPLPFPARFFVHSSSFVKERAKRSEVERRAQETFRRLQRQLGSDACFPVWLAGDTALPERGRLRHAAVDCRAANPAGRHRRYQAAGEYIATQCDLLIALWDDEYASGKAEGTEGIVRVKMRGVTPGLRTMANAFTWADCGSVIHLYMHRRSNRAAANPAKVGKLRWLHASDLANSRLRKMDAAAGTPDPLLQTWSLTQEHASWPLYEAWQTKGNLLLCRIATNINHYNVSFPTVAAETEAMEEFLDDLSARKDPGRTDPLLRERLDQQAPGFFPSLLPLSIAREHAARTSRDDLRRNSQHSLVAIIWLVFLFAVCVHLASHWHPQKELPGGQSLTSAPERVEPAAAVAGREETGRRARLGCAVLALVCAGGSLIYFERHRRNGVEERDQDYRSLAEGLRVQIAWCVAGLSHAAAASYLQRQRNELDWIRTALSTLHLPTGRWKTWFDALDADLRLKLLARVEKKWVKSQADYFERESEKQHHELHGWHKLGSGLTLAGLVLIIAFSMLGLFGGIDAEGHIVLWKWLSGLADVGAVFGLLLVLGLTMQYLSGWKAAYLKLRFRKPGEAQAALDAGRSDWWDLIQNTITRKAGTNENSITWKKWRQLLLGTWFPALTDFVEMWIPSSLRPPQETPGDRRQQMIENFLRHLSVATVLSAVLLAWVIALTSRFVWLPDGASLLFIVSGVCLVGGALLVAWSEKNLLSEHAYQYSAMASFFVAAQERLHLCLAKANAARAEDWVQARHLHPDVVTIPIPAASPTVEQHILEAQTLIYEVGKEALGENGEWLILHRSRPMEPVMPG